MQLQLSQVIKNQMFEGYVLVKASEQRTSSNGSKFLDMTLGDVSGEFNAKMWDGTVQPPAAGTAQGGITGAAVTRLAGGEPAAVRAARERVTEATSV